MNPPGGTDHARLQFFSASGWQKAAVCVALLYAALTYVMLPGLVSSSMQVEGFDFFILLDSAGQVTRGASPYEFSGRLPGLDHPNLNHPAVAVVMSPLARLTPRSAFLVWTALGAVAWLLIARAVLRWSEPLASWQRALGVAALAALPGVVQSLQFGQLGLWLALGVVGAWHFARSGRWRAAGWLLGVLIITKPFLLPLGLLLLRRRAWRGLPTAAAGAAALTIAAVPFVGVRTYLDWFGALSTVQWYGHPLNASLTGLVYRISPADLPAWVPLVIMVAIVVSTAALAFRERVDAALHPEDRAFAILLLASILASPLGWMYYTAVLLPLAVMLRQTWPRLTQPARRATVAGATCMWIPYLWTMSFGSGVGALLGATQTYGMVILASVAIAARVKPEAIATGNELRLAGPRERRREALVGLEQ
jgi:Glycosyltransferase family 87